MNKAEHLVLEYLESRFGAGNVRREATFEFSGRRRFDFEVTAEGFGRRVLVEVDGQQHFEPVAFRPGYPTCPVERVRVDCLKAALALENGFALVRMPTTGVISGTTQWQGRLSAAVRSAAAFERASIVYCDEGRPDLYAAHRAELGRQMKERAGKRRRLAE